jgi:regulator of sirC expression with transglutaminase-like and TPR domain
VSSLHEYLQADPECRSLAVGAVLAVGPLLEEPDPAPVDQTLEAWAFELAGRMPLPWSIHGAIDALNHFLFQEQGLLGDREDFENPENAVLPRVLERRRGLPIALSILWIDLARRLGLDAVGIGLPGHFITGLRLDVGALYFDPFHGGHAVGEEQAARLVRRSTGGRSTFVPAMLDPMPHRAILARLLRNLHARYLRSQSWDEAFWTATHLVLLNPDDPLPFRDRAFVRLKRGEVFEALKDFQEAIRLGQDADPQIAEWVEKLKKG